MLYTTLMLYTVYMELVDVDDANAYPAYANPDAYIYAYA